MQPHGEWDLSPADISRDFAHSPPSGNFYGISWQLNEWILPLDI